MKPWTAHPHASSDPDGASLKKIIRQAGIILENGGQDEQICRASTINIDEALALMRRCQTA
jgi:hypothetical protein